MKLITHKTCPYALRAVITANALNFSGEVEYVDLKNKPDWFVKLTPFAKVPVLIDNQNRVLFESLVIANYLNKLHGSPLSSKNDFTNALNEAWIQHCSLCMSILGPLKRAESLAEVQQVALDYQKKLLPLEDVLGDGPYFNGAEFNLIDIIYAPLFLRLQIGAEHFQVDFFKTAPKVKLWADTVVANPAVQKSTIDNLSAEICRTFKF